MPIDHADRPDLVTRDVGRAVAVLRAGGLVAMPTETVYGLAADAEQPDAVRRIFEVKGRPVDHPLIVHLPLDAARRVDLDGWASGAPPAARVLAATCWPGPLTMLVPRGPRTSDVVTGGRPTVGIRVPSHPLTQLLLAQFGGGVAAPSANRFGRVSPTTALHVVDDIGDLLDVERDVVLDGGPSGIGVESTIVDLTVDPPQVLRAGAITAEQIAALVESEVAPVSGPARASGMLDAHYQPACRVTLASDRRAAHAAANAARAHGRRVGLLDRTHDLPTAARELYADLRRADAQGLDELVVVLPAPRGIGVAIRDRLGKAAAR